LLGGGSQRGGSVGHSLSPRSTSVGLVMLLLLLLLLLVLLLAPPSKQALN
jgi:hypothetical protein